MPLGDTLTNDVCNLTDLTIIPVGMISQQ